MQFSIKKEKEGSNTHFNSAVIGGGPAGLTAGIYLGRAKINSVLFEKMVPGGYVVTTDKIENYPGFPGGIEGEKLGNRMKKQAEEFGIKIKSEEVKAISIKKRPFRIKTDESSYTADTIIIATGSSHKKLSIPGEEKFSGRGISYCATCDAPFFEGEKIAVIGAGNSGAEESLYLTKFAKHVTVIEFMKKPTADAILVERMKNNDKIELLTGTKATRFLGEDTLTGIEIEELETGERKNITVKGCFIYAGMKPNTDFLEGKLDLDENGFILTDSYLRTSREGIFAAGDVRVTPLRQVVTATSDGALAAKNAEKYLEEK